jgi:hypothetical protein
MMDGLPWNFDSYSAGQETSLFYGTWSFITTFTKATHHWILPSPLLQTYFSKIHFNIILSHLYIGLLSGLLKVFWQKFLKLAHLFLKNM